MCSLEIGCLEHNPAHPTSRCHAVLPDSQFSGEELRELMNVPDPVIQTRRHIAGSFTLLLLSACILSGIALSQENRTTWSEQVRALTGANRLSEAEQLVNQWMEAYPEDLDARAWNARLLAWTHRWNEAEAEYRTLAKLAPNDPDLQLGLADVLNWQKRHAEALPLIEQACHVDPARNDCHLRRARTLQNLGRN